jgi:hypothetical protein
MTKPAAVAGTYSDLRFIKGRKVAQVVIEIPIEAAQSFADAFGMPNPTSETWVAMARMSKGRPSPEPREEVKPEPVGTPPKAARRFRDLPLPQQAALRCQEPAFWRYLAEREGSGPVGSSDGAADEVRSICGVTSRSEIKNGTDAGERWHILNGSFEVWMMAP